MTTPASATPSAVAHAYARAMSTRDAQAVAALFAEDGRRTDPHGSATDTGRSAIRTAVETVFKGQDEVTFEITQLHTAASTAAFTFTYTAVSTAGTLILKGIDVLTVDETGAITDLVAYWGRDDVTMQRA